MSPRTAAIRGRVINDALFTDPHAYTRTHTHKPTDKVKLNPIYISSDSCYTNDLLFTKSWDREGLVDVENRVI